MRRVWLGEGRHVVEFAFAQALVDERASLGARRALGSDHNELAWPTWSTRVRTVRYA